MHFFWRKSAFFRPSLYLYIILLTQVLHHLRREEFGRRANAVGFQKSTIRLQPTAEGLGTYTRCAGKFNLCSGFHKYNTLLSISQIQHTLLSIKHHSFSNLTHIFGIPSVSLREKEKKG